ncbi:MAG: hypothetical protein NVSMB64_00900 [Candidatus Velthaea sp.]
MRFDDGIKREVLARTDIAEYIGQFVTLRKRGNDMVGLCPFHGEKTPSFHVHPDRGFFKCFGCSAGGDVIKYVQLQDNLTFPDALRMLAKRAGVQLAEEDPAAARVRSEKEAIYHANEIATQYFHRVLTRDPAGAEARAYCERRGLTKAVIDEFKLGFTTLQWEGLVDELRANNVDLRIAERADLVREGQRGYRDRYRGRLMIPTYSTTGEVIAFGGRALGSDEPKYLNTSTTPVYTKGRFLYALNNARRAAGKEDAIIVVEGYLDCIALHQAGITNAVASLGTAFTPDQARELRKVTANVFICFDADTAGQAATVKSIDILIAAGCNARIVGLPPGDDPDSYVRARGAAGFRELLNAAEPWVQFKVDRELDAIKTGFTGAAEIARRAEALVANLPREEWDRWRVYIAGRLGINVDDLRKSRLLRSTSAFAPREGSGQGGAAPRASRHIMPGAVEAPTFEREVLAILIDEPRLLGDFHERIPPDRFEHPAMRRVYAALVENRAELLQPSDVYALFSEDDTASAALVTIAGAERSTTVRFANSEARRTYLERVVERFAVDDLQRRYREVDSSVNRLLEAGEAVPGDLRAEFAALAAKLKG